QRNLIIWSNQILWPLDNHGIPAITDIRIQPELSIVHNQNPNVRYQAFNQLAGKWIIGVTRPDITQYKYPHAANRPFRLGKLHHQTRTPYSRSTSGAGNSKVSLEYRTSTGDVGLENS